MDRTHLINAGWFLIGSSLIMAITDSVLVSAITCSLIAFGWETYQYIYRYMRGIPSYLEQVAKDIGSMLFGSAIGTALTYLFVHVVP